MLDQLCTECRGVQPLTVPGRSGRDVLEADRRLLGAAAFLRERVRADEANVFNVFTALRSASDEVHLHSRFLYALLSHVDPLSGKRDNLEEFLRHVAGAADFQLAGGRVEREVHHIDLLVANGRKAVVVENKIWADDRDRQLERYRDALVDRGYDDSAIRLLYLTLDGHEPDARSLGTTPRRGSSVRRTAMTCQTGWSSVSAGR